jgi:hypothetical protein
MPAAPDDQQLPRPQEVFISYSRKRALTLICDWIERASKAMDMGASR